MSGTRAEIRPMFALGSASSEIAYGSKFAWITTQLSKKAVAVLFFPSFSLLTYEHTRSLSQRRLLGGRQAFARNHTRTCSTASVNVAVSRLLSVSSTPVSGCTTVRAQTRTLGVSAAGTAAAGTERLAAGWLSPWIIGTPS